MAEIEIERKGGSPWLWVLLALVVVALVAWWFMAQPGDRTDPVPPAPDTVPGVTTQLPAGAADAAFT